MRQPNERTKKINKKQNLKNPIKHYKQNPNNYNRKYNNNRTKLHNYLTAKNIINKNLTNTKPN